MAGLILKVLFWSVFATVIACVEIEAEGKYGWAEKMPTWYRTTGFWAKAYGACMGGKPLTGYHAFLFFVPLFVFHAHFIMGVPWTWSAESTALALFFSWSVMWDYHWFVLNPHYAGKFTKDRVWWHAKSYWPAGAYPMDYLFGIGISILIASGGAWFLGSREVLIEHLKLLGGFALYTAALHVAAPTYREWYADMRKSDDRDKVPIFHDD